MVSARAGYNDGPATRRRTGQVDNISRIYDEASPTRCDVAEVPTVNDPNQLARRNQLSTTKCRSPQPCGAGPLRSGEQERESPRAANKHSPAGGQPASTRASLKDNCEGFGCVLQTAKHHNMRTPPAQPGDSSERAGVPCRPQLMPGTAWRRVGGERERDGYHRPPQPGTQRTSPSREDASHRHHVPRLTRAGAAPKASPHSKSPTGRLFCSG